MTEYLIAISKKIGFSLSETGEMTTQMFLDIVEAYAGEEETTRKATQADIDKFFG